MEIIQALFSSRTMDRAQRVIGYSRQISLVVFYALELNTIPVLSFPSYSSFSPIPLITNLLKEKSEHYLVWQPIQVLRPIIITFKKLKE
jgi:hypothetical protein